MGETSECVRNYSCNVVKAITNLQAGRSIYIAEDDIIAEVGKVMGMDRHSPILRENVIRSLHELRDMDILATATSISYNFSEIMQIMDVNPDGEWSRATPRYTCDGSSILISNLSLASDEDDPMQYDDINATHSGSENSDSTEYIDNTDYN